MQYFPSNNHQIVFQFWEDSVCVVYQGAYVSCGLCIKVLVNIIMKASKAIKLHDFDQVYYQTVLTAGSMGENPLTTQGLIYCTTLLLFSEADKSF